MTEKRNGLVSAALVLVGVGVVLRMESLVVLSIPVVAYVVLAELVSGEPHLDVTLGRETNAGKVFEGGTLELKINITNEGRALELLRVEDTLPEGLSVATGSNVAFASLAKSGIFEMRYKVGADTPGSRILGPIKLTATDYFGLRSSASTIGCPFVLDVLPRVERHRSVRFRPRRTESWPGQIISARPGPGQEFYAVRQYTSGDPVRSINWKAWARLDRMYSNEYMSELGADVVVVVDKSSTSDFGLAPESALTYVERCSAAVSDHLLSMGNRVGMMVVGERVLVVNPGTGPRQLERILLTLVRAKKGPAERLGQLPDYFSIWFPRAINLIVISSLADDAILPPLMRFGPRKELHVISPSFVGDVRGEQTNGISEVALMLVRLRRRAIAERIRRFAEFVEWRTDSPIDVLLQKAFPGARRTVAG
jgi:uncharacterized protein (DUF58 family)